MKKKPRRTEAFLLAVWTRLELATPCVTGMYSNQLNYQTFFESRRPSLAERKDNVRIRFQTTLVTPSSEKKLHFFDAGKEDV